MRKWWRVLCIARRIARAAPVPLVVAVCAQDRRGALCIMARIRSQVLYDGKGTSATAVIRLAEVLAELEEPK